MTNRTMVVADVAGATAAGKALRDIAREYPKDFRNALGMQVRNTQKSVAAVARNYAIKHKVDGKTRTLRKFPKRHKITVALHGKVGNSALSKVRSVAVSSHWGRIDIGFKGRLARYCERWQVGGETGFADDIRLRRRVQVALHREEIVEMVEKKDFRRELYRRLGALGIHNEEQLRAVAATSSATASKAAGIYRAMAVDEAPRFGVSLTDLPTTWAGRPYMEVLAGDIQSRFVPSLASILHKKIEGKIR